MAFSQTQILDVVAVQRGRQLYLSWKSSAPDGSIYQVYVNRQMVWHGQALFCVLPLPAPGATSINVGTVGSGEEFVDFSGSLPIAWNDRAELSWYGGTYLSESIAGFHVYSGTAPGGAVSYTTTLATVRAYSQGAITDGFGMGPFGEGGFGLAASIYEYKSAPLATGTWNFAVKAFDTAGNEGPASTVSITITGPPDPPGRNASNVRLTYTYDPGTRKATLTWLPPAP